MAPYGMREPFHTHLQAADVVANLVRHLPRAYAFRDHHTDRLQPFPQPQPGQVRRHQELDVGSRLLAAVSRLHRLMLACLDAGEVVFPLLKNVLDDGLV